MRIALLFPPQARLVGPCLSLPSLTAFLRGHGHTVVQRDLNIEAHEVLLARAHLLHAEPVLERKLAALEGQPFSSATEQARWQNLVRARIALPHTVAHIGQAKRVLRDDVAFYDYARYASAARIVKNGLDILAAEFEPRIFPLQGKFSDVFTSWTVGEVLAASHDEAYNPFLPYLRDEAVPSLLNNRPDLVGISITYHTQILPGLTLARLLREARPHLPIYLGGAILSELADILTRSHDLFTIADGLVVGEGETALLSLVKAHQTGSTLDHVPNLVYADSTGVVHCNHLGHVEDPAALPTPDYEGLPLDRYLSPRKLGYLSSSRGCYWNRCAFCTSPNALGRNGYRQRPLEQVAQDMRLLKERHGMEFFFFCDDCFAPRRMARLAELLIADQTPVQWAAETRVDRQLNPALCTLLARGGCRHLIFGLESATQRVLDRMNKGIQIDTLPGVLHNCHQAGIGAVLMTFVNFPGETPEEAQATVDLLARLRPIISFATLSCFTLMKGSPVDAAPGKFGIRTVYRPAPERLAYIYDYELTDGTRSRDLEPAFWRASRRLQEIYPIESNMLHLIHFFLHTAHRKTINLLDLHSPRPTRADALNAVPHLPAAVTRHRFCQNGASLHLAFDQASGEMWNLTPRENEVLNTCDGRLSTTNVLDLLADQTPAMERIKQWFQDFATVENLLKKGILRNGHQDRAVIPACE